MPGDKVVRRTLADGTVKEYRYSRGKDPAPAPRSVLAVRLEYETSPSFRCLKPNTRRSYLRALEMMQAFDATPIAEIRRRHIMAHRDLNADQPGTANRTVQVWSVLLAFALDREYVEFNAAFRVKRLKLGEWRRWKDAELAFALQAAPEQLRRAIVLALYTGQREGDLVRMRWSDYDGTGISVVQQKTGAALWVPAHRTLRAELASWRLDTAAPTILTNANGKTWGSANSLSTGFWTWAKEHHQMEGCVFHGLRKCAASALAEAGCSAHEIASITGHASLGEIERYTKAADQKVRATSAIVKLEAGKRR